MPERIQMKRTKGWRKPENCVYVGRPTKWGNPFKVTEQRSPEKAVELYRRLMTEDPSRLRHAILQICSGQNIRGEAHLSEIKDQIPTLRGKDLACWCPIISAGTYHPCHADVLLSLANDLSLQEVIDENIRRAEGQAPQ